jgi:hypothetical protein
MSMEMHTLMIHNLPFCCFAIFLHLPTFSPIFSCKRIRIETHIEIEGEIEHREKRERERKYKVERN